MSRMGVEMMREEEVEKRIEAGVEKTLRGGKGETVVRCRKVVVEVEVEVIIAEVEVETGIEAKKEGNPQRNIRSIRMRRKRKNRKTKRSQRRVRLKIVKKIKSRGKIRP